jgi:C4-dicarboxylate-specific signal transduction histidine kinase
MDLVKSRWEDVDWMHMTEEMDLQQVLVNMVMNLWV